MRDKQDLLDELRQQRHLEDLVARAQKEKEALGEEEIVV